MKTKYEARLPVRLGPEWDFSLWFALLSLASRHLVRHPRRIPPLPLKADTKMKTTNPNKRAWQSHGNGFNGDAAGTIREARAERSQFRDQRSRLHLREFAKNSRIFAAFAPGANRAPQFFFPRKSVLRTPLAFDVLILRQRKAIQDYETDTWNIAGGRSGVSIDALDSGFARSTVRSNGNSKRSAFRLL
jgi:hypothetical protein